MKQEKGEACITRSRVVWVHVKVKDTLPAHQKPELLRMIVVQPAEGSVPPGGSPTSRTVTSCNFASVCQTGKVGDFWSSLKPSRSRSDSWHKRSRIANAILCFTPRTDELTFNSMPSNGTAVHSWHLHQFRSPGCAGGETKLQPGVQRITTSRRINWWHGYTFTCLVR